MIDAILFTVALFAAALTIYAAVDWLAYRRRLRADAELAGVLTRPVHAEQPAPTPGTGDVWAEVIALAEADGAPAELVALMRERRELGIARYGTPLQRDNGRDHRRDLVEELLDACAYAQAAGMPNLCRVTTAVAGMALLDGDPGHVLVEWSAP